ncbi:MAG: hypothetical protein ACOX8V_03570 [Thermoleophilia bacterium]
MTTRRGINKIEGAVPSRCAAMAVGSLPHEDVEEAMKAVFRYTAEIPAWPQLPRRSFLENMYVQYGEGLPGAVIDLEQQRFYVADEPPADEVTEFLERLGEDDPALFAISPERAAGIPALGSALHTLSGQDALPPYVKGQVTGPVSFGLTVLREDRRSLLFDDTQRELATALLSAKAQWQQNLLREWAPTSVPVIVFDEPYMAQLGSAFVNVPPEFCYPLLEECLAPLNCLTGIHICGGADWESVVSLPFDLLSFDACDYFDSVITQQEAFASFVSEGGLLAWGAVPNDDRALKLTDEEIGSRVIEGAEAIAKTGALSVDDVLALSLISPACGTGALPLEVAERCFDLSLQASTWLRERLGIR